MPSSSCTIGSGDEPTSVTSAWRNRYMYGLGLIWRSTRYTSNGSAPRSRSKRCESTTWKMSPARMCSLAASTASRYASLPDRRADLGQRVARVGRVDERLVERDGPVARQQVQASDGVVVLLVDLGVGEVVEHPGVGDERDPLPPVVERGQLADDRQHALGQPLVVVGHVREALDLAHDVVAEVADEPAVQRRQVGVAAATGRRTGPPRSPASIPRSSGMDSSTRPPRTSTLPPARLTNVATGRRPTNDHRPQRSACSTDSRRKPSSPPRVRRAKAATGVMRSASSSR